MRYHICGGISWHMQEHPIELFPSLTATAADKVIAALARWRAVHNNPYFNQELDQSLHLDATGLTTAMTLLDYIHTYAAETKFSIADILNGSSAIAEAADLVCSINALEKDPDIFAALQAFSSGLIDMATRTFGREAPADLPEQAALVPDMAFYRLNALHAIQTLRRDQFLSGETGKTKPFHLNEWVCEFININSMIAAAARQPIDGMTLVLIRDRDIPEYSYFGFLVRYGENVVFLSDRPQFNNPGQKFQRRSLGKDLRRRINSLFMPWHLLDINFDKKGIPRVSRDTGSKIVPYQESAHQLCRMVDMGTGHLIWCLLMTDLIHKQVVCKEWKAETLSYTGEMVAVSTALSDRIGEKLIPVNYAPQFFAPLERKDVSLETISDRFGVKPTGCRAWLEKLYGPQVNPSILDVVTPIAPTASLTADNSALALRVGILEADYTLKTLAGDEYGTLAEVEKARIWTARWNYARAIFALAKEDYKKNHEEVETWYRERISTNLPAIAQAVAEGKLMAPDQIGDGAFGFKVADEPRNILSFNAPDGYWLKYTCIHSGYSAQYDTFYGVGETSAIGTEAICLSPSTPVALALLCGCEVVDLPIYLRHWYQNEPYRGNSILDDVDPMEAFHNQNPWEEFPARIQIFLSKKTLARWKQGTISPEETRVDIPRPESHEELLKRRATFSKLKEKKTGRVFRVSRYQQNAQWSAELDRSWKKNKRVSLADVYHRFEWID